MKYRILAAILPLLLLTGCGSEGFADRLYTRGIGLADHGDLRMSMQVFEAEGCCTVNAQNTAEALRLEEAAAGGKVFIGHTELLCLDGSCTLEPAQRLFFEEGLSPGCKVLYTQPEQYLTDHDCTDTVHTLRMSERNGLLPMTELATVLEEWLGTRQTALVPSQGGKAMAFLRTDGSAVTLSKDAAAGMRWLRRNTSQFSVTLGSGETAQDIEITRIRLRRTVENDTVKYTIRICTKNSTERLRRALRTQVQAECDAAITEMFAAGADVIGLEEFCELHGMPTDTLPTVTADVAVE